MKRKDAEAFFSKDEFNPKWSSPDKALASVGLNAVVRDLHV